MVMDALPFCRAGLDGVRCLRGPYFRKVKGYPLDPRTISEAISKRRLDLGLRQVDVAKLIGCDKTSVVNWEKGHTSPRANKIAGVKKLLSTD